MSKVIVKIDTPVYLEIHHPGGEPVYVRLLAKQVHYTDKGPGVIFETTMMEKLKGSSCELSPEDHNLQVKTYGRCCVCSSELQSA